MEPLKVSIIEAPCRTLSSPKNMGIWVTKQSMDPIDCHSMEPINLLVSYILQNIFFMFSKIKKFIKVWNNLRLSK